VTDRALLSRTLALAAAWLDSLPERPVGADPDPAALAAGLGGPLPERGLRPIEVVERLAAAAEPGLVASPGPRYFGFVIGGSLPAAMAADLLATAWDQNAGMWAASPAAAAAEEVAGRWVLEALGLPLGASVGFVSGGQMASFTGLAAARNAQLARAGWDVEADGLAGAPPLRVLVSEEIHVSVLAALRMLGLGARTAVRVPADEQGRMLADALGLALAEGEGPAIVCAQAGHVNSGAVDPLEPIADRCAEAGAWLHVDGAVGLWAAASPALAETMAGLARADSWAADAHKWLNVPYDSGIAIVAHPEAHRAAMTLSADYLVAGDGARRDGFAWAPEASRRARGFAVWAALRSLGRAGLVDLVERCRAGARAMAERLGAAPGVEVLNEVVLNQVLVRFAPPGRDADALTRAVVSRVQREGTCWLGGTLWRGAAAMRVSVSNWSTGEEDVARSAAAILDAYAAEAGSGP
jgi:glutamate/tyrosine decarboxylase-like PLP-dependent enzyme